MPLYEFRCESCGSVFERLVRSVPTDEEPACPSCGSGEIRKELSVFAAHQGLSGEQGAVAPCRGCEAAQGSCPYSGQ